MPAPVVRLRVRRGSQHPWIYRGMVKTWDKGVGPGSWVTVVDKAEAAVGQGFFNPRSQIAVRLLTFGKEKADPDATVDALLRRAASLRRDVLRLDAVTDAFRVVNSEGDGLSGLIADRYADAIVLELFSIWPLKLLPSIERTLADLFPGTRVFARTDGRIQDLEGFISPADRMPSGSVQVREHDLKFWVNLSGHKTGAFLDQRENRKCLSEIAAGKTVLDGCCYTGGFALSAAAGGASEAVGVDLDEAALDLARKNASLNRLDRKIQWTQADLFAYLRDAKRHNKEYDVVVLDPPKFVSDREGIKPGMNKYYDLNKLAIERVRAGGVLVSCSCSGLVSDTEFLEILSRVSLAARRPLQIFRFAHAAADHPFLTSCLESRYLKTVFARVAG